MPDPTFQVGDRVRFTTNNLGGLGNDPQHARPYFIERHFGLGDEGEVVSCDLPDGWLAVLPDDRPDDLLYVPVHPNMIEPA